MNDRKLRKLLDAARNETPPSPPSGFETDVMRAIHNEPFQAAPRAVSVFDQLNLSFPKLALAAVLVIGACLAVEYLVIADSPSAAEGVAQLSDQWLYAAKGF